MIDQILLILPNVNSINELLEQLGYKKNNSTQRFKILKLIRDNELNISHFGIRPRVVKSIWNDSDQIKVLVKSSTNIMDFLHKMGLSSKGSNRDTAKKHIGRLKLDCSHWSCDNTQGLKKQWQSRRIATIDILDGKHPGYQTCKLKDRLFKEHLKNKQCEECGITQWNNKPLTLHLDHINGNSRDHRLSNLRILCPNCHSQTDTYAGKNISNKNRGFV